MRRSLDISTDIVDLGSEMFASVDLNVINYKGENYYRACGEVVSENKVEGTTSHCIKPVGHVYSEHEDAQGMTGRQGFRIIDVDSRIRADAFSVLRRTGIEDSEIFNVLNALQFAGFTLERGE